MCGIIGELSIRRERRVDRTLLEAMCRSIKHRGPDDEGLALEGRVGLGAVRLSIIDLTTGHQPIYNEDGTIVVAFNGEIYNFQELRGPLESAGHRFKTHTDTEVLVHLYEEHGDRFVEHLRGMFAIALWDGPKERLLLARDRLGVKPLYYWIDSERLLFGSEIKAIFEDPSVPRVPDYVGIDQMLRHGFMAPPRTCFQGISELPPASLLTVSNGKLEIRRYWDLHYQVAPGYSQDAALDRLGSLLEEAVRLRLISDVPLGALLSGGIDSALVVATMSRLTEAPVKTFTIGFEDKAFSEVPFARQVAQRYRTEHHEFTVKPDVRELLPELIWHHDVPFYDSSAIPTYYVCKMAREHVTVVLSGDGGDELFAGYNLYLADKAAGVYRRLPGWLRDGALPRLARLVPESGGIVNKGRVLREFCAAGHLGIEERYKRWTSKIKAETRDQLYGNLAAAARDNQEMDRFLEALFRAQPEATSLGRLLYADIHTELAGDVLPKVDRMSMACSLEVRSPFLDHRLHEWAATLPDRAKIRGWRTKHLSRELARRLLPAELLNRPKQGFVVPLDRWFREDLAGYSRDVLLDPATKSRAVFDPAAVEKLLRTHAEGNVGYGREIWMMLVVELWHRMYIDRSISVPYAADRRRIGGR